MCLDSTKQPILNMRVKKKSSRLTAYYVTTPNSLPQKPGGNTKWYKDMVSTVPKPTNTRQNPTVKRSIPVELVPAKTKTTWTMPDGQKPIIPKDEGLGVMLSGIVSRELGFGLKVSHEDLQKVNKYRANKSYSDVLAAMEKRGTTTKQPLETSPFIVEFEYGANAEGYWTYDHMVLQFEDCVDHLKRNLHAFPM
jgi:hypothetical protein